MLPTTVTFTPYDRSWLKQSFNQNQRDQGRAVGERAQLPLFVMERLAVMKGTWQPLQVLNPAEATEADYARELGELPGYLFHFLTGTEPFNEPAPVRGAASIARDVHKRLQANLLYRDLELNHMPERLPWMQWEDPSLIPTITLGGVNELPRYAKYDVVCATDDAIAMAQLRQAFNDPTCEIRGLRLKFGANAIDPATLKDIKHAVACKPSLSAIELKTHPANTAAETEVFRAIGANSNIKQLSVRGELAAGHRYRHGMITALSNPSLNDVKIAAHEASCLHMLDCAAEASGPMTNTKPPAPERTLRLSMSYPKYANTRDRGVERRRGAPGRIGNYDDPAPAGADRAGPDRRDPTGSQGG